MTTEIGIKLSAAGASQVQAELDRTQAAVARASASVNQLGASARQTAAAMRQVPAQFTDIVTALQAGQAPLTVLLQQGGQLKDAFGGAVPAARALAGYVANLITPTTLLAGAAGAVAIALAKGSLESTAFVRSLVLSGNAAGVTAGRLADMAQAIGKLSGVTVGQAAEALAQMAASGRVGAEGLERYTAAAIELQRVGGAAVKDTVAAFADLGKSPLDAALKLNEATNFLTTSTYQQIKALEEQGRTTEAARTAQDAYAAAIEQRAPQIVAQLGLIERAWIDIKQAAAAATNAALDIGRNSTTDQRQSAEGLLGIAQRLSGSSGLLAAAAEKWQASLRDQIETLRETERLAQRSAAAQAQQVEATRAQVAWDKEVEKGLDRNQRLGIEALRIRNLGVAAGKSEAEIQMQINALVQRTLDIKTRTDSPFAALAADIRKATEAAEADLEAGGRMSDARRLQIDLVDKFVRATDKLTDAQRRQTAAAIAAAVAERARVGEQAAALALLAAKGREIIGMQQLREDGEAQIASSIDEVTQAQKNSAAAAADRLEAVKAESRAATLARTLNISLAEAIERVTIARLEETRAQLVNNPDALKALEAEIAKRRELAGVIASDDVRRANERAIDDTAKAWERAMQGVGQTISDMLLGAARDGGAGLRRELRRALDNWVIGPAFDAIGGSAARSLFGGVAGRGGSSIGGLSSLWNVGGSSIASGWEGFATSSIGQSFGLSSLGEDAAGNIFLQQSAGSAGFGSALSSAGPYLAAATAIYTIAKSLDKSGTPHFGGYSAFDAMGKLVPSYGAGESNRSADYDRLVGDLIRPIGTSLNSLVDAFKLGGGFGVAGTFKAQADGADGAWGVVQIDRAGGATVFKRADGTLAGDPTKGFEDYTKLLGQSVREAIDALDLPGWADGVTAELDQTASTEQVLASIDKITQTGRALDALSANFETMGGVFERIAGNSQDVQYQLAQIFGGVDVFAQQAATYYEAFYSDAEKAARSTRIVADALAAVNLQAPTTREAFRALVEAQDPLTTTGQQAIKALLGVSGVFAELYPVLGDVSTTAQAAADILRERQTLERQILQLEGNTAELRARELAALDPSNRALQERINALQDAADAEKAAAAIINTARERAAQTVRDIATAAQRVAQAQTSVRSALQAIDAYGQGLRSQIADAQQRLGELQSRAAADVVDAQQRLTGAVRAFGTAAEAAAQRVQQAERALEQARASRGSAATSIAGLLAQQGDAVGSARGSVLQALLGLRGNAADALGNADAARGRITDAYLAAVAGATQAQERLADLQGRGADAADKLAQVMGRLNESISDYLLELTSGSAGLAGGVGVNRALFQATAAQARNGDAVAAARLVGVARQFLDASKGGSVTGAAYDADVRLVRRVLAEVQGVAAAAGGGLGAADTSVADAQAEVARALADVERLRGIAAEAGASLTANSIDLLAEWRQAQDAATDAQQAYLRAAELAGAAGVDLVEPVDAFAAALEALTASQGSLDDMLARVSAAGVDLGLADTRDALQTLLDGYSQADRDIESATTEWRDAVAAGARAADVYASAQAIAAAAGVQLGQSVTGLPELFEELGAASRALVEAQRVAATIGAPPAAASLEEEFRRLQSETIGINAALAEFERRVQAIDLSSLQVLDPLGDLLQTYSTAVSDLLAAQQQQSRVQPGSWQDIGGGFSRYISTGGAVAIARMGQETLVSGIDGRSFGLGAIQEYVRQLFDAGDLATIYQEAVAFGIGSGDLERISGTGAAVLAWARAAGLPAFAAGADYVARTGLALVHEGERVLPAADNAALVSAMGSYHDMGAELRALRSEVQLLREQQFAGQVSIAESTRDAARTLKRWDGDGAPVRNAEGTTLEVV